MISHGVLAGSDEDISPVRREQRLARGVKILYSVRSTWLFEVNEHTGNSRMPNHTEEIHPPARQSKMRSVELKNGREKLR